MYVFQRIPYRVHILGHGVIHIMYAAYRTDRTKPAVFQRKIAEHIAYRFPAHILNLGSDGLRHVGVNGLTALYK